MQRQPIENAELRHGDCVAMMAAMGEASVDSIVTDPPYFLGFMGKDFDRQNGADTDPIKAQERHHAWAVEALRVLKPGGHLLAFGGTRTVHRLTCALEDAGFEIRDSCIWLYGSGFAKSWNFDTQYPLEWCSCGGNAVSYNHAEQETKHGLRSLWETDIPEAEHLGAEQDESLLTPLQQSSEGASLSVHAGSTSQKERENAGLGQSGVGRGNVHRTGQGLSDDPQARAPKSEAQRVRVGTHLGGGEDAGQATNGVGGSAPHQQRQAGQSPREPENLREPQRALDDGALPGRGACPRCGLLKKEYEGFGSALKPAHEPIVLARKPLCGTIAQNVLEHGTGALNIDGCRVEGVPETTRFNASIHNHEGRGMTATGAECAARASEKQGRWPANVMHDGSPEVVALFPQTTSGAMKRSVDAYDGESVTGFLRGTSGPSNQHGDSGSAARFFYCAKADKRDRDEGLEGMALMPPPASARSSPAEGRQNALGEPRRNGHPTVKPTGLMRYLVRLVTPPGGTVLDPFMGSGTTGKAVMLENVAMQAQGQEPCTFIGVENDGAYFDIARRRIAAVNPSLFSQPA